MFSSHAVTGAEMASTAPLRDCTVTKKDGKGYGFFLRIEKDEVGHLVRAIEKNSSAEKAGLKDGDRVLRVNDTFVDDKEHIAVVDLIKASGNSVTLLVLDKDAYENAQKKGEDLSKLNKNSPQPAKDTEVSQALQAVKPIVNGISDPAPKPRICYIAKDGGPFGFSIKTVKGASGLFLASLAPNGVAVKAGVREGDRIIELNGKNVENDTHDQLVQKVKDAGANMMFLVADKQTEDYFKKQKMKITADKATVQLIPLKPRIVDVKKDPNGYGFYLRQEKNRKGHFIMEIDPGSPADKAKLKDYDRIVAVNGECVEQKAHEEVVTAIQKGSDRSTLLVVDKKTDELYTLAGISPFLYLKESNTEIKSGTKDVTAPVSVPVTIPSIATKPEQTPSTVPVSSPAITPIVSSPDPKYKPRLCILHKNKTGYGFHLNAIKEVPGQFIKQVARGGPADVGGVKEDDILLEVNGMNVEKEAYEQVVQRIKESGENLTLLVASQEVFEYFKAQKIPIKSSMADPLPEDNKPPNYADINPAPAATASKARSVAEPIEIASQPPAEESKKKEDSDSDSEEENDDDTAL